MCLEVSDMCRQEVLFSYWGEKKFRRVGTVLRVVRDAVRYSPREVDRRTPYYNREQRTVAEVPTGGGGVPRAKKMSETVLKNVSRSE
jgi:hypothetical protein